MLFALGATIGTVADQLHVRSGVLAYPHPAPWLGGEAPWVPLLFGAAGVVLPLSNAWLLRLSRGPPRPAPLRDLAAAVLWFFAAYLSTALFQGAPLRLAAALGVAWLARLAAAPALDAAVAGPAFAVAGSLFEAALSSTGAFRYLRPDLLLVPAWLPALYLHASLMTRAAAVALASPSPPGAPRAAPRA